MTEARITALTRDQWVEACAKRYMTAGELDQETAAYFAAACDLPEGWEIRIDLERHAGVVFLIDTDGNETMSEGGELFSDQINAAIDAAIELAHGIKPKDQSND